MEQVFYQVSEIIIRKGYLKGKRSLKRITNIVVTEPNESAAFRNYGTRDIFVDSLKEAKAYIFGYVANRMFSLEKIREEGALPGDGLELFLARNAKVVSEEKTQPNDGKPFDYFDESDKVTWEIDLVTVDGSPKWSCVYDSSQDDRQNTLNELLKEAISQADEVEVDMAS